MKKLNKIIIIFNILVLSMITRVNAMTLTELESKTKDMLEMGKNIEKMGTGAIRDYPEIWGLAVIIMTAIIVLPVAIRFAIRIFKMSKEENKKAKEENNKEDNKEV